MFRLGEERLRFRKTNGLYGSYVNYKPANATYASSLLDHAERLFAFADKHRGSYTRTFSELSAYYSSTTYQDELLWAASWLSHALSPSLSARIYSIFLL